MTATSDPPNLPVTARLILAIVLSVSVHSLLLFGLGRYHAGVGVSDFPFENSGVLRVRIVNLAPDETPAPGQAPPAQETMRAVLSVPATAGGASPLPAPVSRDKPTAPAPPLQEMYYRTGDLDVKPQITVRVMPVYPETAVLQNIGGRVVIRVFISETGTVDDVEVVKANPPGIFDDSAITAFRSARFIPGMKGHKAVNSMMTLEVTYGSAERQEALTGAH
jgi:protein TonB